MESLHEYIVVHIRNIIMLAERVVAEESKERIFGQEMEGDNLHVKVDAGTAACLPLKLHCPTGPSPTGAPSRGIGTSR